MTRKEFAAYIGIDVNTLGNWEKNRPNLVKLLNKALKIEYVADRVLDLQEELEEIQIFLQKNNDDLKINCRLFHQKPHNK